MSRLNLLLTFSFCFLLITSCHKNDNTVSLNDPDSSTISINQPIPVAEGDGVMKSIHFLVTLEQSDPNNPITVNYSISGGDQSGTGGTLTFPANTAVLTQVVTVTTNGDFIVQADIPVTVTLFNVSTNASLATDNLGSSSFTDDDVPGFTVMPLALVTKEEGAAKTFTVVLDAAPASDVVFDVFSSDITEVTVSPDNITFTKDNYNVPRTVTVTPISDFIPDGDVNFLIIVSVDSDISNVFFNELSSTNIDITNENNN